MAIQFLSNCILKIVSERLLDNGLFKNLIIKSSLNSEITFKIYSNLFLMTFGILISQTKYLYSFLFIFIIKQGFEEVYNQRLKRGILLGLSSLDQDSIDLGSLGWG